MNSILMIWSWILLEGVCLLRNQLKSWGVKLKAIHTKIQQRMKLALYSSVLWRREAAMKMVEDMDRNLRLSFDTKAYVVDRNPLPTHRLLT